MRNELGNSRNGHGQTVASPAQRVALCAVATALLVGTDMVGAPARADQPSTPLEIPFDPDLIEIGDRLPPSPVIGPGMFRLTTIPLNFQGSQFILDSGFIPPDTMGTVGPNHIVELLNGAYTVYNKQTGAQITQSSLFGFFTNIVGLPNPPANTCVADVCTRSGASCTAADPPCRGNTIVDPRIVYDPATNRWFAAGIDLFGNNNIYLARSDTDDPTGDWDGVRFSAETVGAAEFHDYPTLAVDADGVYLCTQDFGGGGNESCYSIPKADMLLAAPTAANMTRFEATPANLPVVSGSIQASLDFGASDGRAALLGVTGGALIRGNILGAGAAGATLSATTAIAGDPGHVSPPAGMRQPHPSDPTVTIENVAPRFVANVFELGNSLWAVHSVEGSGGNSALRWYEIDETTDTVLQTGLIDNTAEDYYDPSIAANALGDVVIGYTCSGPNLAPSSCVVVGETNGGVTTFAAQVILQLGAGHYFQDFGTGRNRWGDYSATVIDPVNPCAFWTFQEFVAVSAVGDVGPPPPMNRPVGGSWGVQITQLCTDDQDPAIPALSALSGAVDANCELLLSFSATVTDNCSISTSGVTVTPTVTTANATLSNLTVTDTQVGVDQVQLSGTVLVSDLTGSPANVQIRVDAVDNCGSSAFAVVVAPVTDNTPPVIAPVLFDSNGPYEMDADCVTTIGFSTTVTDNCCVEAASIAVTSFLPANVTLQNLTLVLTPVGVDEINVTGVWVLANLTQPTVPNNGCLTSITLRVDAADCAGNAATPAVGTNSVVDVIPPEITCPDDIVYDRGLVTCPPLTPAQWLASATATDNCSMPVITNDANSVGLPCGGFPCDGDNVVTFTATDECNNQTSCKATLTVVPRHPGWNNVDVGIDLTANQPTYWSALTGQPSTAGVSPFPILDPGCLPGRKATDGSGDRVLRGYIVAWAVDGNGTEIRWNHLKGDAVLVNYANGTAWEYTTYSFAVVNAVGNGAPTGVTPGQLDLDGNEYDRGYGLLLLDFYASGASPFLHNSSGPFSLDTDLTLLPLTVDLRQETEGPVTTKASFTVWNMNEVKLTGLDRCITCWDQTLLSQYASPNHFLRDNLQTDKGQAQIDGLASALCDFDYDPGDACTQASGGPDPTCDPRDVLSQAASLLGVAAKHLAFDSTGPYDAAGMNLIGMGEEDAMIQADIAGGPPPERFGELSVIRTRRQAARRIADELPRTAGAAGRLAGPNERGSASEKGSLLIFSKVELRWNALGDTLTQDTFIDLTNDYPGAVQVQMYFINGDPAITP